MALEKAEAEQTGSLARRYKLEGQINPPTEYIHLQLAEIGGGMLNRKAIQSAACYCAPWSIVC
jgi:hypothetical protein